MLVDYSKEPLSAFGPRRAVGDSSSPTALMTISIATYTYGVYQIGEV
jgi:hypothetical protein